MVRTRANLISPRVPDRGERGEVYSHQAEKHANLNTLQQTPDHADSEQKETRTEEPERINAGLFAIPQEHRHTQPDTRAGCGG